jgi:hypothetical protein
MFANFESQNIQLNSKFNVQNSTSAVVILKFTSCTLHYNGASVGWWSANVTPLISLICVRLHDIQIASRIQPRCTLHYNGASDGWRSANVTSLISLICVRLHDVQIASRLLHCAVQARDE